MTKIKMYMTETQRFSRQWWAGGLRNWIFVALVSLLVWVYADMDVTQDETFEATIALSTGDDPDLVLLSEKKTEARFKLRGTRQALAQFQQELQRKHAIIECDISQGYETDESELRLEDILNNSAELSRRSLSLLSVSPTTIRFQLDRRVRQSAKVVLDVTGGLFETDPVITPAEVFCVLARSDLQEIRKRQNLEPDQPISIKTRLLDLRNIPTGQPQVLQLDLLPPPTRFPVELETKTVSVTVKIDQRTGEKTLPVAVQVRFPHTWTQDDTWNEYRMVKKDLLQWQPKITVSGAKKDLDRLRPEDVEAAIVLSEDDKTPVASWLSREVTIRFPEDMDLQLVSERPKVQFKLEKRSETPAAP